jgi:putative ABC transport system substrate-binding protein
MINLHKSFVAFFLTIFTLFTYSAYSKDTNLKTVAITQIVSHKSLDKVHQGVVDQLTKSGYVDGKNIKLVYDNPQGNLSTAVQIASKFASLKPDVAVAITTTSAQTLKKAIEGTDIPLVFATVTDPVGSGLVPSLENHNNNITGTRNAPATKEQAKLVRELLPNAKTIGVMVNYSDEASVKLLADFKAEASKHNFVIKDISINSSSEVKTAVNHLIGKVDAIFLQQDNTVASAVPTVIKIAKEHKVPVIAAYSEAVEEGAVASISRNEYNIGIDTGKIIIRILQGENIKNISVVSPQELEIAFNTEAAIALKISISKELLKKANLIYPSTKE